MTTRAELPWQLEWVVNRLIERPDWQALVPLGTDKVQLRTEVAGLMAAMMRPDNPDMPQQIRERILECMADAGIPVYQAIRAVDEMSHAGLLPTAVEYRVHPSDCPCSGCETAALAEGATRQRRYLTDWTAVEI